MRSPTRGLGVLVAGCLAATTALCPPAWAAPPAASEVKLAEAKALEAKAYFKNGLFREAADTFMEAYALSKAPDMMYNAARAYEQATMYERAKALFETYLGLDGVTDDGKRDAEARIQGCQAHIAERAARDRPDPARLAPDSPGSAKPAPVSAPVGAPAPVAKPAPAPAATTALAVPGPDRTAWILVSSGAAALVGAGALYGWAYVKAANATQAEIDSADAIHHYNSEFNKAQLIRWSAVGAGALGAVALGWGAWRGWGQGGAKTGQSAAWLAPMVGSPGLLVGGQF